MFEYFYEKLKDYAIESCCVGVDQLKVQ